MLIKVNSPFAMFQEVYLISDSEQLKRQVVQINILPGNLVVYLLSCNGECSEHYTEEIADSRQY